MRNFCGFLRKIAVLIQPTFRELIKKKHSFLSYSHLILPLLAAFFSISALGQIKIYQNGQGTLRGNDAGIHLDTPTRQKIDLSGTWSYTIDENWKDVKVPGSFDYQGRMTFVRKFTVDEALLNSSAFKLIALGMNYDAEIYINDVFIGKHVGGYTTIEIDIPDNTLQLGAENAIKVIVNNTLSAKSTIPLRKQIWGWRNYGGILRDIYLLATPRLWINDVVLQTKLDEELQQGTIQAVATITSKSLDGVRDTISLAMKSGQTLFALELLDKYSGASLGQSLPQTLTVLPNRDNEVHASLVVSAPKLWSVENPDVYILRAKVFVQSGKQIKLIDARDHQIGFRKIQIAGNAFVVNGKRMMLNGVLWQEDSPQYGGSLTYEQMEKDVALIKTMGANAIRFAFHPPHPYLLNLCSRYGLFALVEIPVWNAPGEVFAQETFQALAEAMLTEMVNRDRHQPSVLAWGIGDDFDSSDPRSRGYVERAAAVLRKLDERPIYFGSRMLSDDVCADVVDIAAVNIPTHNVKQFRNLLSEWKLKHSAQPVVLLRYGKEVEPNNRNGYSDPMSQESQAQFFKQYYAVIKDEGIAGSFISSFADWRGDRPLMTVSNGEQYIHPMGVVSFSREKRAAYDLVKSLYNSEKTTALPIGRYRASFPFAHIIWGFIVIFVMAYLYHYNRRFNESFMRSLVRPYNFFADLRDVRSVSIPQTIILAGAVSVTLALVLSGILYHYRTSTFADYIITQFVVSDAIKERIIAATWSPFFGILGFSLMFLTGFPIIALCVKLFSMFVKRRIYWYHAFAITVWGALPIVLLSPVGMALFKLLESQLYVIPVFVLLAMVHLWVFIRILKGVSVLFDVSPLKAYSGGIMFSAIVLGGGFVYYESVYAITAYVEFIFHIARSLP